MLPLHNHVILHSPYVHCKNMGSIFWCWFITSLLKISGEQYVDRPIAYQIMLPLQNHIILNHYSPYVHCKNMGSIFWCLFMTSLFKIAGVGYRMWIDQSPLSNNAPTAESLYIILNHYSPYVHCKNMGCIFWCLFITSSLKVSGVQYVDRPIHTIKCVDSVLVR